MAHRDDQEAAHRRADALERELREAQAQLDALRGGVAPAPPTRRGAVVLLAVVVCLMGAGVAAFVAMRRPPAPPPTLESDQARQARDRARLAQEVAARELPPREPVAVMPEAPALPLPQPLQPSDEITWRGEVRATSLPGLRVGDACTLTGVFSGSGAMTVARSFRARCGVVEAFDVELPGGVIVPGLREGPVAGSDAKVYLLSFTSQGQSPRHALSISTPRHHARFEGPAGEGTFTELLLRDVSEARTGESHGRPFSRRVPAFADALEREARVTRVEGRAPVSRDARCVFQLRPVWEYPESCRIALRCGDTWLYGANETGYLTCAVDEGRPSSALDENPTSQGGDPRLRWSGSSITVSDFTEEGAWSVRLTTR